MISSVQYGGLGNQLFIKAATIAHAMRHGFKYAIPEGVVNPHKKNQLAYNFPKIKNGVAKVDQLSDYKEPFFHYCEIPPMDNIRLDGYWQSKKYFDDLKDEIIDLFDFRVEKLLQGWCGIHVRRGDYLQMPEHHPAQTFFYYLEAMNYVSKKTGIKNFMIFSDDMDWCKQMFSGINRYEIGYREGYDEISDLMTLASCVHQIISNSSYSWWAQYLNPNPDKIVVAPKKERWFGPQLPHDVKDLYEDKWFLI